MFYNLGFWILITVLKESRFFPSLVAIRIVWKMAKEEEMFRVFFKIEKKSEKAIERA